MKNARNFVRVLILILVLFGVFWMWYANSYAMQTATSYSVNTPEASYTCLVATQGSEFKDDVVSRIIDQLKNEDLFIRVIDVTQLKPSMINQWDAILILHTWEYDRPPKHVRALFDSKVDLESVLFFATSGDGSERIPGVDALSGASKIEDAESYAADILEKLEKKIFSRS